MPPTAEETGGHGRLPCLNSMTCIVIWPSVMSHVDGAGRDPRISAIQSAYRSAGRARSPRITPDRERAIGGVHLLEDVLITCKKALAQPCRASLPSRCSSRASTISG